MQISRLTGGSRWLALSACLLLLTTIAACGYRLASSNRVPQNVRTVYVDALENRTNAFRVEQLLRRSLVRTLVERSGFRVVDDAARADAVLDGVVTGLVATPVAFGQETFGSTFLVTVNLQVEFRERTSGTVLFKNENYVFREQYVINVDPEHFFTELNPALERIASDFALSVVTTIVEGF
jgi:outer membrane lipopolysaccharide assembly protein LptE/RlpB